MRPPALLLLTVLIVLSACTPAPPTPVCDDALGCVHLAPGEPLKIAVLQVLSGENAVIGVDQLRAVELAVLEQQGTLLGHPLELLTLDSHCSREGGATAALHVISDPRVVGVIGTSCSGAAVAAMEILHTAGLTMISGSNTAASLTRSGNDPGSHHRPGYFRTAMNDEIKGLTAARFARNALGITRAATVEDGDPYTKGLTDVFAREFRARHGIITTAASVNKGDTEMAPLIAAIRRSGAELIFLPIFRPEGDWLTLAARQHAETSTILLMSADGLFSEPFITDMGPATADMYFVIPAAPQGPAYDHFIQHYHDVYGEWPAFTFHAHAYDATELLLQALTRTAIRHSNGNLTIGRRQLMQHVEAMQFEGLTGMIRCDTFGDCGAETIAIVQVPADRLSYDAAIRNVVYKNIR